MAFYLKIQQQIQETNMQTVTLSHADSVRAALEDGPKTYQGVAKWARENGNPAMDFPLANRICDRMVREGRVFKDDDSGVYSFIVPEELAETTETPQPTITIETPAPLEPADLLGIYGPAIGRSVVNQAEAAGAPPPAPSLKGPLYPPSGALIGEVDREAIAMACAPLPIGGAALFTGPKEDRAYEFGQVIRNTLNQRSYTKRWHWSVSIENNEERVIRVVKMKERDGVSQESRAMDIGSVRTNPSNVMETPKPLIVKSAIPVGISMALVEIDAKIQDLESIKRLIYCVYGNPV